MSAVSRVIIQPMPSKSIYPPEPTTHELFKGAFRHHAAGVAIITADGEQGPVALTATSVISVSADPPVLAFSLSADSGSASNIKAAKSLVVHLLQAEQIDIARLCSTRGADRFSDTSKWRRLPTGEPVFIEAPVWIRGTIIGQMEIYGSTLVAVGASEISAAHVDRDGDVANPLIYHDRAWHALSDASKLRD